MTGKLPCILYRAPTGRTVQDARAGSRFLAGSDVAKQPLEQLLPGSERGVQGRRGVQRISVRVLVRLAQPAPIDQETEHQLALAVFAYLFPRPIHDRLGSRENRFDQL